VCLLAGRADHPSFNSAQRFRLGVDEVEDARAKIQAWFPERDRPRFAP
jgi:hypothetical protein